MKRNNRACFYCLLGVFLCNRVLLAGDVDGDGVEDSVDACNNTPQGVQVSSDGRPLGDVDGDCDSDLKDHALIEPGFTGPLLPGCASDFDCEDDDPCTVNTCNAGQGECITYDVPNCANCTVSVECGPELTCGLPIDAEINPSIETDKYCFCVTENEKLRVYVAKLASAPAGFSPNWRILDAGSNPVGPCGSFVATAGRDCGPLPAAGNPYRLEIEDQDRDASGAYSVHVHFYDPSEECGTLTLPACESSLTSSIEHVNDVDLIAFNAAHEETVRISVFKDASAAPNFASSWRLLDRNGFPASPCDAYTLTVSRDCGRLSAALNPYRIEIEDQLHNEAGTYHVHLQRLTPAAPCGVSDIACDTVVVGSIDPFVDSDLLSFAAGTNEMVRITVLKKLPYGPSFSTNWRLLGSDGVGFGSCEGFATTASRDCGPLSVFKSPYRIEIEDQGRNDTGSYEVYHQRLTQYHECDAVTLPCQVPIIASTDFALDTDLFRFNAREDETVRISVIEQAASGVAYAPNWRLLNAAGVPSSNCSTFFTGSSRDCGPLPASGNPFRVEVEDQGRNDVGSFQIIADFLGGCPQE